GERVFALVRLVNELQGADFFLVTLFRVLAPLLQGFLVLVPAFFSLAVLLGNVLGQLAVLLGNLIGQLASRLLGRSLARSGFKALLFLFPFLFFTLALLLGLTRTF